MIEFDVGASEWVSKVVENRSLKVVAFNVWFGSYEQTKRCDVLCDIVATQLNADVVCLQEVTAMFLARMREHRAIRADYQIVVPDAMPAYGVVTLIRRGSCVLLRVEHTFFPSSSMQRSFLLCELAHATMSKQHVVVVNTHLESLQSSRDERVAQMQLLFQRLERLVLDEGAGDVLVMGDFNFDPSWPEQKSIPTTNYVDCWLEAATSDDDREKREQTGFTEDTYRNAMRFKAQGKHKQVRFDRILLRRRAATARRRSFSSSSRLSSSSTSSPSTSSSSRIVESCTLIGTEPFEHEIWPSDHFGLCAVIAATGRRRRRSSSSSSKK